MHDSLPTTVSKGLTPPTISIKQLATEYQKDKDPFDLREEIAITRAAVSHVLEAVDTPSDLVKATPALNQLLNTTGKLVKRLHEIEVGRRYVVRVELVQIVLKQVLAVVVQHVPDPVARAAIAEQILSIQIDNTLGDEPTAISSRDHDTVQLLTGREVTASHPQSPIAD